MTLRLSSDIFWVEAGIVAVIDLALLLLLWWRIKPAQFRRLKWDLVAASGLGWGIFAVALLQIFWDWYYVYLFPESARWLAPIFALIYAAIGLAMWWLSCHLPGNPVLAFCLLAGLESVLEHLWGIYGVGILDKVPLLEDVAPLPVLVFAFFEYILYWGVVLAFAAMLSRGRQIWTHSHGQTAGA